MNISFWDVEGEGTEVKDVFERCYLNVRKLQVDFELFNWIKIFACTARFYDVPLQCKEGNCKSYK